MLFKRAHMAASTLFRLFERCRLVTNTSFDGVVWIFIAISLSLGGACDQIFFGLVLTTFSFSFFFSPLRFPCLALQSFKAALQLFFPYLAVIFFYYLFYFKWFMELEFSFNFIFLWFLYLSYLVLIFLLAIFFFVFGHFVNWIWFLVASLNIWFLFIFISNFILIFFIFIYFVLDFFLLNLFFNFILQYFIDREFGFMIFLGLPFVG